MTASAPDTVDRPGEPRGGGSLIGRILVAAAAVVFVVFWVWALFFASKESINRIGDRAWAERGQEICAAANLERDALADYRRIDPDDPVMVRERADLVERSTDVVEQMVDDLVAVAPADAKGAEIVPLWEADYRTFVANRRDFADAVRRGSNEPFRQAETDGVPISERISRFAVDNDMPACAAPRDL